MVEINSGHGFLHAVDDLLNEWLDDEYYTINGSDVELIVGTTLSDGFTESPGIIVELLSGRVKGLDSGEVTVIDSVNVTRIVSGDMIWLLYRQGFLDAVDNIYYG